MDVVRLGPEYFPDPNRIGPIANGYIYVGIPDLDPTVVANQKQVTLQQEDGTLVEVSQPVRTNSGGVPVYSGSPVTILVSGDYSLAILSSSMEQEYYIPSSSSSTSDASFYYPDYSAVDQGISGDANTIKFYVDAIGSDSATIVLRHNSGLAQTEYTLNTSETIPANIILKIENGAILTGTGTLSLNNKPEVGDYQVFDYGFDVKSSYLHANLIWFGGVPITTVSTTDTGFATGNVQAFNAAISYLTGSVGFASSELILNKGFFQVDQDIEITDSVYGLTIKSINAGYISSSNPDWCTGIIHTGSGSDDRIFDFTGDSVYELKITGIAFYNFHKAVAFSASETRASTAIKHTKISYCNFNGSSKTHANTSTACIQYGDTPGTYPASFDADISRNLVEWCFFIPYGSGETLYRGISCVTVANGYFPTIHNNNFTGTDIAFQASGGFSDFDIVNNHMTAARNQGGTPIYQIQITNCGGYINIDGLYNEDTVNNPALVYVDGHTKATNEAMTIENVEVNSVNGEAPSYYTINSNAAISANNVKLTSNGFSRTISSRNGIFSINPYSYEYFGLASDTRLVSHIVNPLGTKLYGRDSYEGEWVDISTDCTFSGNASTWTVSGTPADTEIKYSIVGKMATVRFRVENSTSGATNNRLTITLPSDFPGSCDDQILTYSPSIYLYDPGGVGEAFGRCNASAKSIQIYQVPIGNWSTTPNVIDIQGFITFPIVPE